MLQNIPNETILLKQYISEKDYKEISELEKICYSQDKTNLKLELDYRLNLFKKHEIGLKEINEFLYYVDDTLVAYLNISTFGDNNIAEINGMTHPNFRRKGLFNKIFQLAVDECKKRKFNKILLLCDGKSSSGINFITSIGGTYDFSEFRMKCFTPNALESTNSLLLRKAEKHDAKEISRQNSIFSNHSDDWEWSPEQEEAFDNDTYMIELNEKIIGKIVINCADNSAFICGFGILPDFRSKGYGKEALKEALNIINKQNISEIELDVECKNNNALNLYKSCGFEKQSVMNYYEFKI